MRSRALVLLGILTLALSSGCRRQQPAPLPVQYSPPSSPTMRQEMAALAFLAYLGGELKGSDEKVEQVLSPCLQTALEGQPHTSTWTLAWGPAVYKFAHAELDDNLMYVARREGDPAQLAIVVRGTNPPALLDWLVEDAEVKEQVSWEYGNPPGQPKIARGTHKGLQILQDLVPDGGPAKGQTLQQFLAEQARSSPFPLQIHVTGHSLGGALAPVLALWLHDTRSDWAKEPVSQAQIRVYPLAGPTPGDADFASYYNAQLGEQTDRMQNPFDLIPLAWNHQTIGQMADLYEPLTRAGMAERGLIDSLRLLVKDKDYTPLVPDTPLLSGALNPDASHFLAQVGWQHHCGYQCALGINVPTSPDCSKPATTSCDRCPQE